MNVAAMHSELFGTAAPVDVELPPIEPGIYFNMPSPRYHRDKSLGSGSIKDIALDPTEWQWSKLHDVDKDSAALTWGQAIHARGLEGRAVFESRFACEPNIKDHPGALVTMEHLREHCKRLNIKPGTRKADAVSAIRDFDQTTPIWDEIIAAFERSSVGKTQISRRIAEQIEIAAQWMQADETLGPFMTDGTFTVGASEVSIFYVDNGVRLKARIDHLLTHALLDLKSFRPPVGWRVGPAIDRILGRVIAQNRYDIQAACYIRAWTHARALFEAGRVFDATDEQRELLKSAMNHAEMKWIWALVKNTGAPQSFVRQFPLSTFAFGSAMDEVNDAIDAYRANVAKFGADRDWIPHHAPGSFADTDFPSYMGT
jgi:hypothetical protein